MRTVALTFLTLLAACGVGEDRFQERYATTSCELLDSCDAAQLSFGDQADCETYYGVLVDSTSAGCDYSPPDGATCLKALDEAGCQAALAGIAACNGVYSGAGCEWASATTEE
ncbi:MAG: hypothetical protein ACI8PZ_002362 [Myxococcota bacterium]|jgi:hypothetical protein